MRALAVLLAFSLNAYALDLRPYFPDAGQVNLNTAAGNAHARYTFTKSPSGFANTYINFFNLNKPGYHYVWQKEYWKNAAWCNTTYAVLFMGDDLSVSEVGDWYGSSCSPNRVFGYRTDASVPTGLAWSPVGGLTTVPTVAEMNTWAQPQPGTAYQSNGYKAYSKTGLVETLEHYTPPYGRDEFGVWGEGNGTKYWDVVHLVMYHGTKAPSPIPVRCDTPPVSANGPYYQSFKDYNSYAIELWLAAGVGIIQERTTFIESGTYWNLSNCIGEAFSAPNSWTTFIDD